MGHVKNIFLVLAIFLFFPACSSAEQTDANSAAVEQAKQDYRIFLQQLKQLNSQYKEITNEIKEVVKEEGVPVWDERTDELTISKDPNIFSSKPTSYDPGRPPVFGDADIQETERDMIVKVDVPGVDKSKLKVQLEDSKILRVSGERNSGREENGNQGYIRYHHVERQHGYFQRMIELPAPAKDNAVPDARYENGVLTIRVPKAENSRKEVSIPIR